jgi:peptidoglycan/LPS O-acetylase OafA/YrhL
MKEWQFYRLGFFARKRGEKVQFETFENVLDTNLGLGPGFDFMRLFLATSVLLWHSFEFAEGPEAQRSFLEGRFGPLVLTIVPAFFALSGFLVTGSLLRLKSTKNFIVFRALRIVPALLTEVFLSAMILGPIVTELPIAAYFKEKSVWTYFTNVVGRVKYFLPGVFQHQNITKVNGALWTVPGEMLCYVTLLGLMLIGLADRRFTMACLFVAASVLAACSVTFSNASEASQSLTALILCFYAGATLFHYRHRVPISGSLVATASIGIYLAATAAQPVYLLLAPICVAYVICYLGMTRMPHIPVLMDGDHSYGIYLYHCPILQTWIWASNNSIAWPSLFAIGYPTAVVFSIFSWRFIEKPSLALRKRFVSQKAPARHIARNSVGSP